MSKTDEMQKWIEVIKQQKMLWMRDQKNPDMNPTVFVEREGRIRAIVVAPMLDKWQGLHAARACRTAFDADALTVVFDAHVAELPKGTTPEQMREMYPPGSMQRMCDEEGACKTRKITDCMICHRIEKSGRIQMANIPYFYDEKYEKSFHWLDDEIQRMDSAEEGVRLEGTIPETMAEIMKQKSILEVPHLNAVRELMKMDRDRALFHSGRAVMKMLEGMGFICSFLDRNEEAEAEDAAEAARTKGEIH